MDLAAITIPHGILIDGFWLRQVELREMNGYDEQILLDMSRYPLPFKTTALLGGLVKFGNGYAESYNMKTARELTVGDRIALVLYIRRTIFGDKLHCTLSCPNCKEAISLDLSISNLLQPSISDPKSEYELSVENYRLTVRPIKGADLESIATNVDEGTDKMEKLVRACVISSDPCLPSNLDNNFISVLSSKLEKLDPQADLLLDMSCPVCKDSFQTSFNAEDFVYRELSALGKELEYEIHWLAFYYHWSEDAILSMTTKKRKRYVDLINRTLFGERM
jgi:hypothetical protein